MAASRAALATVARWRRARAPTSSVRTWSVCTQLGSGRQGGGTCPKSLPRHHVDLYARFLQGPQHACLVRSVRTRAAQNKRGATLWGVTERGGPFTLLDARFSVGVHVRLNVHRRTAKRT